MAKGLVPPSKVGKLEPGRVAGFTIREGFQFAAICMCGFASVGWPMKKQAQMRRDAHALEHESNGEVLMPDKAEVEALTADKFLANSSQTNSEPELWGRMAIADTDILYKYSVAAAAGNTTAGTAATSLGDQISTTQITTASLNNLFDDVSGDENAANDTEYRGFFVHNNHGSLTWTAPFAWLSAEVAGGATAAISVDATAASAVGSASFQMKTIADESTAPATQTFSSPTTKAGGLALSDLPNGQVKGIWVRRQITGGPVAAVNSDGVTIRVEGDTAA